MRKVKLLFLAVLFIILLFLVLATSSYAKLENYLYQNNNREYYYILTDDFGNIGSSDPIESYIHEEILDNLVGKDLDPDAVNRSSVDYKYYFYYWLHGVCDMVDYIGDTGIDYQVLSGESEENLKASINVLRYARNELGTYTVADNDLPTDIGLIFGGDRITQKKTRSSMAYGDITRYTCRIC